MNTVAINSNVYRGAEDYANMHNISVADTVERALLSFLQGTREKQSIIETARFKAALSYVKALRATGGRPVPADENSIGALVEKKYSL